MHSDESDEDQDSCLDLPWPVSRFSKEMRALTIKAEKVYEEPAKFRPFPHFDATFVIASRSAKWFVNEEKIQKIRKQWTNYSSSRESDELELLERQKAAKLIELIGVQLFV